MSKILNIDDMLEAARELQIPDYDARVEQAEAAAGAIGASIATALGIHFEPATWEGKAFGGLCMTFRPAIEGQACPEVIDQGDPSGDWE